MTSEKLRTAAVEVLEQGIQLLSALDQETYSRKIPTAFNASIGAHFRHCLDHFEALVLGHDGPIVNYDARKRDPRIEIDRDFAINRARELSSACEAMLPLTFSREIAVKCKVTCDDEYSPLVSSTYGREAMYTIVHAIHHYALIKVMCQLMEIGTPEGFGIAPSTIRHHAGLATA